MRRVKAEADGRELQNGILRSEYLPWAELQAVFSELAGSMKQIVRASKMDRVSQNDLLRTLASIPVVIKAVASHQRNRQNGNGLLVKKAKAKKKAAASGATIIQVCYWLDQYRFATLRLGYSALLGHLIRFLSRLNFIIASAVFSAIYLVRFNHLEMTLWKFALLFTALFSIFCYTLELERLGRALLERKDRS